MYVWLDQKSRRFTKKSNLIFKKNPAYGRQGFSQRVQIVAPILWNPAFDNFLHFWAFLAPNSHRPPLAHSPIIHNRLDPDKKKIKNIKKFKWMTNVVKVIVPFEPIMQFWCLSRLRILKTMPTHPISWRKTKNLILWPLLKNTQTDGHGDSMTNPIQRAETVKKEKKKFSQLA